MEHTHPNRNNPNAPKNFDFDKFAQFCERGFSCGLGKEDGQICIEAAISLCSGEGLGDKPTCVHPAIRAHTIKLNDARWSSPAARAKGMCDYGLAQLGTTGIDGVVFAKRLAFLTITKLLPVVLRLVTGLDPQVIDACENAADLETARSTAIDARNGCRKPAAAYAAAADAAAYAAVYAADAADAADDDAAAAAYAAAAAAAATTTAAATVAAYAADVAATTAAAVAAYAADVAAYAADYAAAYAADYAAAYAADARDRILALSAELATQAIKDVLAGLVQQ